MSEIINIIREAWDLSPKETIKTIIGILGIATGIALFCCWLGQIIEGLL